MGPARSTTTPGLSPVSAIRPSEPNPRTHQVLFYHGDAYLLDDLVCFVGEAVDAGDAALVVATETHRAGLADRLRTRGTDVARAAAEGRYLELDAEETLSRTSLDGSPDPARFADIVGGAIARASGRAGRVGSRVAVFGEMVALLYARGRLDLVLRLEDLWNDLARSHPFTLRCAYPLGSFPAAHDGEALDAICAAHTGVIPAESYASLGDDAERMRAVVLWQQKAQALQAQVEARERSERALRERSRELEAAVAARDAFLSVAAHELNTPVTGLGAFAQLLLRDASRRGEIAPKRLEAGLQAIEREADKLTRLVARLLDAAHIEAGTLRIDPARTDLAALVRAVLARHQGRDTHTILFEGPERLDATVDPNRMELVVASLVDNAVKFSPEAGRVTAALERDDAGGIRLSVTDEGPGIPADQRERLFDRLSQGVGDRHLSGMGLGLHVSREIVALHGGCVRIEEPEHPGVRVVVTLPPSAASEEAKSGV